MYVRTLLSTRRQNLLQVALFLILFQAPLLAFLPKDALAASQQANGTLVGLNSSVLSIHVSGNQLINAQGQATRFIGVNIIAGACVPHGSGLLSILLDGPSDAAAAAAIAQWHVNVVRITPNEDCWLGINGVNPAYSGDIYRTTIVNFVNLLHSYGIYAIIDLHSNAPGNYLADNGQVMADADHASAYWQSVATTFKSDPAVIFEPYNEPHISTMDAQTTNPWQCWRDGCTVTVVYGEGNQIIATTPWQGVGMQSLINTIRSTGATNPIMLAGLNWSQDLTQFLQYLPTDPQQQLIASYHNYMWPGSRNTPAYWNSVIAPIAQQMPVVTGEFGEKDCQARFVNQYMAWADAHNVSYLPWVWVPWGCGGDGLLSDWAGTPSAYGQVFYTHFHLVNP